jgi:hypothetical protein
MPRIQENYSSAYIGTATTTVIKPSAGFLHTLTLGETAAGAITIYDNATAASGTIIAAFKASIAEQTFTIDAAFKNGCTIITAGASKLTVSFI